MSEPANTTTYQRGERRGEQAAHAFLSAVVSRMNTRQNHRKGSWLEESYETRRTGLIEESYEAWKEAYALEKASGEERVALLRGLIEELEDAGAENLMTWDKATKELEALMERRAG